MRFATLCSGIGAPEVAAHRLGMTPVFCSEIEPFPCAVLAHHWPDVPNYGDMTKWRDWPHHDLDLLIAGTPCQAFSVAGLRQGLDDARGNLTLEFARYVNSVRPRFVLWENVPGVLSDKSNAFGCLLGGLAGCDDPLLPRGGRWTNAGFVAGPKRQIAWRILDAQHFGVAQRRRRVWLCAGDVERGAGDWACARALFPEPSGVRGDIAQGREAREEVACAPGGGSHWDGGPHPPLMRNTTRLSNQDIFCGSGMVPAFYHQSGGAAGEEVAGASGGGVAVAVYENHAQDSRVKDLGDTCSTVSAKYGTGGGNTPIVCAFNHQSGGDCRGLELRETAQLQAHQTPSVLTRSTVRRLTPRECERLQGFPDDHTLMRWKSLKAWAKQSKHMFKCKGCGTVFNDKHAGGVGWLIPAECPTCGEESADAIEQCSFEDHLLATTVRGLREPTTDDCPDGPRYKALGNSMAVPCVQFILENLQKIAAEKA